MREDRAFCYADWWTPATPTGRIFRSIVTINLFICSICITDVRSSPLWWPRKLKTSFCSVLSGTIFCNPDVCKYILQMSGLFLDLDPGCWTNAMSAIALRWAWSFSDNSMPGKVFDSPRCDTDDVGDGLVVFLVNCYPLTHCVHTVQYKVLSFRVHPFEEVAFSLLS